MKGQRDGLVERGAVEADEKAGNSALIALSATSCKQTLENRGEIKADGEADNSAPRTLPVPEADHPEEADEKAGSSALRTLEGADTCQFRVKKADEKVDHSTLRTLGDGGKTLTGEQSAGKPSGSKEAGDPALLS
jgi:hypothetical protein